MRLLKLANLEDNGMQLNMHIIAFVLEDHAIIQMCPSYEV